MSKINVNTWEPESSTAMTMGASGDTTTVPSGASLVVASGATLDVTGATKTGFPSAGFSRWHIAPAGTYTVPTDITKIIVEVQAGGGGGGAAASGSTNVGSGGASGAYAKKYLAVTAAHTMTVVIGAKGDKGAYGSGAAGTAGGTSSFTNLSGTAFTAISCTGGGGGAASGGTGGTGGATTTGDININGQNGMHPAPRAGGSSPLGQGGVLSVAGNGPDGTGYGAGGSGGLAEATGGGDGSVGIVIITEYK